MIEAKVIGKILSRIMEFHSIGREISEGEFLVVTQGDEPYLIHNTIGVTEDLSLSMIHKNTVKRLKQLKSDTDFICVVEVNRALSLNSRDEMETLEEMILDGEINPQELSGERVLVITGMDKSGYSFRATVPYAGHFSFHEIMIMDVNEYKASDIYDEETIAYKHGLSSGNFHPSAIFSELKEIEKEEEFIVNHYTKSGGVKIDFKEDLVLYSTLINANAKEFESISSPIARLLAKEMPRCLN